MVNMSEENKLDWFDEEENDIWRIRTGKSKDRGPDWLKNDLISIGWGEVGDLREYLTEEGEIDDDKLEDEIEKHWDDEKGDIKGTLKRFYSKIKEGDLVLAYNNETLYGLGKVEDRYEFDSEIPKDDHPHIRKVSWLDGIIPTSKSKNELRSELKSGDSSFKVIPRGTLESVGGQGGDVSDYRKMKHLLQNWDYKDLVKLDTPQKALLENKRQVILYGPPGTGKTYKTKKISIDLLVGDNK